MLRGVREGKGGKGKKGAALKAIDKKEHDISKLADFALACRRYMRPWLNSDEYMTQTNLMEMSIIERALH